MLNADPILVWFPLKILDMMKGYAFLFLSPAFSFFWSEHNLSFMFLLDVLLSIGVFFNKSAN